MHSVLSIDRVRQLQAKLIEVSTT